MIKLKLLRLWFRILKKNPATMPMVRYWKTADSAEAKITKGKNGMTLMVIEGEDYPIMGFPRSHILFGPLSPLKHFVKDKIFNDSWKQLEAGINKREVIADIKTTLRELATFLDRELTWIKDGKFVEDQTKFGPLKYDLMPPEGMATSVREIHRAWTKVTNDPIALKLRDITCLILQEDDGYRYRVQWMASWFPWIKWNPVKCLDKGLQWVEHGEVIGDMKGRIRLLRRILLLILEDPKIKKLFVKFFREVDWRKVKLSKGDKYHFRGKYFKVDLDKFEY